MVYIDDLAIGSRTWAFQRTHYWCPKIQDGCLVFEKIAFFCNLATDRRTDGHARRMKPLSLSRAAA